MATSNDTTKRCTKCGEFKPATNENFPSDPKMISGLRSWCRECIRIDQRTRRLKNPIASKETNKRSYEKHKDKRVIDQRKYYANTKFLRRETARTYYANHKEKRNKYNRDYYLRNPLVQKVGSHNYEARKKALPNTLTQIEWESCLNYWEHLCAVCRSPIGLWNTIALDHWIPLNSPNCPGTVVCNIIPLCHCLKDGVNGCNNSKQDREVLEWLTSKLGKRKAKQKLKEIETYFEWVRTQTK